MNKSNVSIVIADDHPLMLKGLTQELQEAGYTISKAVENGAKALDILTSSQPDIAILDIEMPVLNGYEVVKRSSVVNSHTRYILMTYHKTVGFALQAKKLNIQGFLLKEDDIHAIENCIATVLKGGNYFSKSFDDADFEQTLTNELQKIQLLTPTERSIIRLIAQKKSSVEIADILLISKRTVEKHRSNIIAKLGLKPSMDTLTNWIQQNQELIETLEKSFSNFSLSPTIFSLTSKGRSTKNLQYNTAT